MFYFFSKTLSYFITPAGWLVAALLLALFTKKPARRRWGLGLALGIFWLFGNPFLINELVLAWEYPPAPVPTDSSARIAVVLTGGMTNGEVPVPDSRFLLGPEADRAGQALYLYKRGVVQYLLISGGNGGLPFQRNVLSDENEATTRFLQGAGVRAGDMLYENKSRNTYENAVFTARFLRQRANTNRCVLITSAWHMRRAVGCFQKAGLVVTPFPGGFRSHPRTFLPGEWLLPNAQTFFDAHVLLKEVTGYGVYRVAGYL